MTIFWGLAFLSYLKIWFFVAEVGIDITWSTGAFNFYIGKSFFSIVKWNIMPFSNWAKDANVFMISSSVDGGASFYLLFFDTACLLFLSFQVWVDMQKKGIFHCEKVIKIIPLSLRYPQKPQKRPSFLMCRRKPTSPRWIRVKKKSWISTLKVAAILMHCTAWFWPTKGEHDQQFCSASIWARLLLLYPS